MTPRHVRRLAPLIGLTALLVAGLACGGRVFTDLRVYSLEPGSQADFYDSEADVILKDNVWVFRPDGTFEARITVTDTLTSLLGHYEGDNIGSGFVMFLDFDGDQVFEDEVSVADDNSYIEWEHQGQTYRFVLAP